MGYVNRILRNGWGRVNDVNEVLRKNGWMKWDV